MLRFWIFGPALRLLQSAPNRTSFVRPLLLTLEPWGAVSAGPAVAATTIDFCAVRCGRANGLGDGVDGRISFGKVDGKHSQEGSALARRSYDLADSLA